MSDEKKYTYKILTGIHQEGGKTYAADDSPFSDNEDCAGSIIQTDNELEKHNVPGGIKFAQIDGSGRTTVEVNQSVKVDPDDGSIDLTKMTVVQLKELAAEHDIDLEDLTLKADIIEIIAAEIDG